MSEARKRSPTQLKTIRGDAPAPAQGLGSAQVSIWPTCSMTLDCYQKQPAGEPYCCAETRPPDRQYAFRLPVKAGATAVAPRHGRHRGNLMTRAWNINTNVAQVLGSDDRVEGFSKLAVVHGFLDEALGTGVDVAGGLVQDEGVAAAGLAVLVARYWPPAALRGPGHAGSAQPRRSAKAMAGASVTCLTNELWRGRRVGCSPGRWGSDQFCVERFVALSRSTRRRQGSVVPAAAFPAHEPATSAAALGRGRSRWPRWSARLGRRRSSGWLHLWCAPHSAGQSHVHWSGAPSPRVVEREREAALRGLARWAAPRTARHESCLPRRRHSAGPSPRRGLPAARSEQGLPSRCPLW